MTNLMLAMDEFTGENFEPWIDQDEVPGDMTHAEYAQQTAEKWREGLKEWGMTPERARSFKQATQTAIYTPGSDAGLPVSVLSSFNAPAEGWSGNEERLREQIERITTAMLTLIGQSNAGEVENPSHILITNLFEYHWARNNDLSLQRLIQQIQNPPFDKLGVMEVNRVISKSDRMALAKELNNIIAAPHFQTWLQGPPLDFGSLLYTADGTPRTLIFYTNHLDEEEQQFIHTMLFERIMAWVHTLSGSNSLRALVYVDEVFGMLPPHPRNPATKAPIMRMLKQARAFGVGVVLATQNPTDVDYKALSNTGMWFLGKLQTDNDKDRALEAVSTAADGVSINTLKDMLGELETREFVVHNIHDAETPYMFQTRWAMSYLAGPLTRDQINPLMQPVADTQTTYEDRRAPNTMGQAGTPEMQANSGQRIQAQASSGPGQATQPAQGEPNLTHEVDPPGFTPVAPNVPSNTEDYFLPVEFTPEAAMRQWNVHTTVNLENVREQVTLMFRPVLMAQNTVRFKFRKSNSSELLWYAFLVPELPKMAFVNWGDYQSAPFDPDTLEPDPPQKDALYAGIPSELMNRSAFSNMKGDLQEWIYNNLSMTVYVNPKMGFYGKLGESYESFYERMLPEARERREEEITQLAEKYDKKLQRLEDQISRKRTRAQKEAEELEAQKVDQLATTGESLLRLMRGQLYRTISQIADEYRWTRSSDEQVEVMKEDLAGLMEDVEELQAELEREVQKIKDKWARIVKQNEEVSVSPNKSDITTAFFGIGWVPFWGIPTGQGTVLTIPATPSGLAEQQIDIFSEEVRAEATSPRNTT
jgi:hypothetical protein